MTDPRRNMTDPVVLSEDEAVALTELAHWEATTNGKVAFFGDSAVEWDAHTWTYTFVAAPYSYMWVKLARVQAQLATQRVVRVSRGLTDEYVKHYGLALYVLDNPAAAYAQLITYLLIRSVPISDAGPHSDYMLVCDAARKVAEQASLLVS